MRAAAALPSWYCSLEREGYYRRTDYIHEIGSVDVGSHLYGLMCCAGRSESHGREGGRGWRPGLAEGEGGAGSPLTFSMPASTLTDSKGQLNERVCPVLGFRDANCHCYFVG